MKNLPIKINKPRYNIIHDYNINNSRDHVKLGVMPKVISNKKIINIKNKSKPIKLSSDHKRSVVLTRTSAVINRPRVPIPKNAKSKFDPHIKRINTIRGIGKGKILAMFAPGPSILEAQINKLKDLKNVDTMTINKPDLRFWPTKYWMFCDRSQYVRNKTEFEKFPGIIINTMSINAKHKNQYKIRNLSGAGFSSDLSQGLHIGRSTTYSAMQVAAWMDYDYVFIFGIDMCKVVIEKDGKKIAALHSYGVNPDVPEPIRLKRFKKEAESYSNASKIINEDLRKRYYFCSKYNPWPFVDRFNRLDQTEAVDYIEKLSKEIKDGK
jgi:hypothetical protein